MCNVSLQVLMNQDFIMDLYVDSCNTCVKLDSIDPNQQGDYGIPPFQTYSRSFYTPIEEECCAKHFVVLYF